MSFSEDKPPFGLVNISTIAQSSMVTESRLREVCESKHCPHYMINGLGPFFKRSEVMGWILDNLVEAWGATPLIRSVRVFLPEREVAGAMPMALADIRDLHKLSICGGVPGVYFLVRAGSVVYVGQATCVARRVGEHLESDKVFDSAFFITCPRSDLLVRESSYIKALNWPEYNRVNGRKYEGVKS